MCSSEELVRRVGDAVAAAVTSLDDPATGPGTTIGADYLALRRLVDQLEVVGLRWLAALDAGGVAAADGSASTAAWVRRNTGCAGRSAAADVQLARRLHTDDLRPLTITAALLDDGRLTVGHARVLARASAGIDPEALRDAEPLLAEAATSLPVDAPVRSPPRCASTCPSCGRPAGTILWRRGARPLRPAGICTCRAAATCSRSTPC